MGASSRTSLIASDGAALSSASSRRPHAVRAELQQESMSCGMPAAAASIMRPSATTPVRSLAAMQGKVTEVS
ncbi:MAG: hypothetical protein R3F45_06190 [Gammaproteobacteria bacterium]